MLSNWSCRGALRRRRRKATEPTDVPPRPCTQGWAWPFPPQAGCTAVRDAGQTVAGGSVAFFVASARRPKRRRRHGATIGDLDCSILLLLSGIVSQAVSP
ncbi:MAG: hypothetical protein R3E39_32265 [Anaerolineae bacterium]